jgi:hypothetical protein
MKRICTAFAALALGALAGCGTSVPVAAPGGLGPAVFAFEAVPGVRSLREFGVASDKPPAENRAAMQAAIDWASGCGGVVWVEPTDEPYPMASGLVLKRNASIVGAQGPVGRGTKHATKPQPVGSVFRIEDTDAPFITVETATRIEGVQFWYPKQTLRDPQGVIAYPPTIQVSKRQAVHGVTLRSLTFFGEFLAMDFAAGEQACEQILFEHCYGYPLGGEFIRIDRCYDIPRILHCHVNPANRRAFAGDCSPAVVDSVIARGTYAYAIDRTDNAQVMDVFTFGTYGGIKLGHASYGQMTNFNFDCVTVGVWKGGDSAFNRNWMIAQGSIIANAGKIEDIHPIVVEGMGHLAVSNVEAFSGPNAALTVVQGGGRSRDFLEVRGDKRVTVSLSGCRMRNYESQSPITMKNPNATVVLRSCFDREERLLESVLGPSPVPER